MEKSLARLIIYAGSENARAASRVIFGLHRETPVLKQSGNAHWVAVTVGLINPNAHGQLEAQVVRQKKSRCGPRRMFPPDAE